MPEMELEASEAYSVSIERGQHGRDAKNAFQCSKEIYFAEQVGN